MESHVGCNRGKSTESVSFRDLVSMPTLEIWDEGTPGDFGGMGMSAEESAIFYAIGSVTEAGVLFMTSAAFTHCELPSLGSAVSCN